MKTTLTVVVMMSLAATAGAQVLAHEQQSKAAAEQHLQVLLEKSSAGGLHLSFESRPVTGAPYSGEAVTETVQVLGDGNRIVNRNSSRIYRDGKGRTRREMLGPNGQVTGIVITDPTAGKSYVLDPGTNTAHLSGVVTTFASSGTAHAEGGLSGGTVAVFSSPDAEKVLQARMVRERDVQAKAVLETQLKSHVSTGQAGGVGGGSLTWVAAGAEASKSSSKEDLGQQTIEGVLANGTRTTTVIAAGAIGNEQPITVVSEEWVSPDLKVLVMTRHADPRAGETTYRLTGISRNEPNPSLFELPAGVSVK